MKLFRAFVACLVPVCLLTGCSTASSPTSSRVVARIEFANTKLTGVVSKEQLPGWWNQRLKIGSDEPDAYEFVSISTSGQDKRIRVENCAEYTNALQQGASAFTTFDMTMESWFQRAVGVLRFMEQAKPSTWPLPGDLLTRLPVSLLGWNGSEEEMQIKEDARKGITLKDYERSGKVKHLTRKQHHLSFQTEGQDFSIEELARGDVDGDGFEDALIFVTWHYRGGSGFGSEVHLVTRSATGTDFALAPISLRQ